ncbi:MAG: LamG domain-containing protein [Deltaproteobacteria bacterium]|nr:LamG domain-containing protein [Deltaproteobacteria bacterium]
MTYGWALIIIATVLGALVFIVATPTDNTTFSSVETSKFLLKGTSIDNTTGTAEILLQNTTGGNMEINSIIFSGNIGDSLTGYTLNGQFINPTIDFPLELTAGAEISLGNLLIQENGKNSSIYINYTDFAGLEKETEIKSGSGSPQGLVAAYWFNEVSGGFTPDGSGNKNTGVLVGPPTLVSDCPSGACLEFGGDGDRVGVGNIGTFSEVTVSWWRKMNPTDVTTRDMSSTYGITIYNTGSDKTQYLFMGNGTAWSSYVSSNSALTSNTWYNFVGRYNGITVNFFIDGVKQNVEKSLSPYVMLNNLSIGSGGFNGSIDQVTIYNRALSDSEIAAEYARSR